MRNKALLIIFPLAAGLVCHAPRALAQTLMVQQAIEQAQTFNPQVRAARYRWESARRQIIQNHTPTDPQFSFSNLDSPNGFLTNSGTHNIIVTLQFPGKAFSMDARKAMHAQHICKQ